MRGYTILGCGCLEWDGGGITFCEWHEPTVPKANYAQTNPHGRSVQRMIGGKYRCGCPLEENEDRSSDNWFAFRPKCSEHDEGPDWERLIDNALEEAA